MPFWRRAALAAGGRVLELGCGTGRVAQPLVAAGVDLVGIDRSEQMLKRALTRYARTMRRARRTSAATPVRPAPYVRGDIRSLPFADAAFAMVIAPYGILQSLTRERDLAATLAATARVLAPGGTLGVDLVPDVPNWREYRNRVQFRGTAGTRHLTLVESVRQDRRRGLTTFSQTYIERRGRETTEHTFDLAFRTLTVPQMIDRLQRAGFRVDRVLGDYRGRPWDARADAWIILAVRV